MLVDGQSLDLGVVAEGIETTDQEAYLIAGVRVRAGLFVRQGRSCIAAAGLDQLLISRSGESPHRPAFVLLVLLSFEEEAD